jgi:subtilisin family serine protease
MKKLKFYPFLGISVVLLILIFSSWQSSDKNLSGFIIEKSQDYCFVDQGQKVYPLVDYSRFFVCFETEQDVSFFEDKYNLTVIHRNESIEPRISKQELFEIDSKLINNQKVAVEMIDKIRLDENVKSVYPVFIKDEQSAFVDNVLIVNTPNELKDVQKLKNELLTLNLTIIESINLGSSISFHIGLPRQKNVFELANLLSSKQYVNYAQPNFIFSGWNHYLPNDIYFSSQWYLHQSSDADIDAPQAWDISQGSSNIVVAVIDGNGYDLAHEEMTGRYVSPYCAVNENPDPSANHTDENHGTCCAGIISAITNNNLGVASVGVNTRVMPIRIGFDFIGNMFSTSTVIIQRAAQYMILSDEQLVAISNSYGLSSWANIDAVRDAYESMRTQVRDGLGAVVLASTGNEGAYCLKQYPCCFANVVGVGASTLTDSKADFSNYGDSCDIVAPGVDIWTIDRSGNDGYDTGDYTEFGGTSASCPIAAGVIGLIASIHPDWNGDQLMKQLCSNCDKVGSYSYYVHPFYHYSTWSYEMGYGRINAFSALKAGGSNLETPTNLQAVVNNNNVSLSWDAPTGGGSTTEEWLSYNDGTFENAICSTNGDAGLAQLFELPGHPANLKSLRFFVDETGNYDSQIQVFVLSGNGVDVLAGPYFRTGVSNDWIEINLDVFIDGPTFLIATYNTNPDGPYIGIDDSDYQGNLYFGNHIDGFTEMGVYEYYYVGSHEAFVEYATDQNVTESIILKPSKAKFDKNSLSLSVKNTDQNKFHLTKKNRKKTNKNKSLIGYNVYRNGDKVNTYVLEDPNFDDTDVIAGKHYYSVTAVYDEGESNPTIEVEVQIEGLLFEAPTGLLASIQGCNVNLYWYAPGSGNTSDELIYDNNACFDGYYSQDHILAIHMSPSAKCKILQLKYFTLLEPGDHAFKASIYNWNGSTPGNNLLFEQNHTAVDQDWVVMDISSNDVIVDGDFMVGFGFVNTNTYLGFDNTLNNGRSWVYGEGNFVWTYWEEAFLIRAVVEYSDGSKDEIGMTSGKEHRPIIHSNFNKNDRTDSGIRSLTGFNIYRNNELLAFSESAGYSDVLTETGTFFYKITATYTEGESEAVGPVSVTWNSGFGIDENELSQNISLAPNPAKDQVFISSPEIINEIKVFNMQSEVMKHELIHKKTFKVNVEKLKAGIYFMYLHSDKSVAVKKFVVN